MDGALSTRRRELRARLDELFTPDLSGTLRRLGERGLGAGSAAGALDPAEADARAQVWQVLCELGLPRLAVPGDPWRQSLLGEVAGVMGHALYASPLPECATVAELVAAAGADPLRLLPGLAEGRLTAVLAAREDGTADPEHPAPLVAGDGTVTGRRRFVPFAAEVDYLLVAGDAGMALVPRAQPGVQVRRQDDIARGDLYTVVLREAAVPDGGWLGGGPHWPGAAGAYAAALANARLRHAAYLLGSARAALQLTTAYTKQRQQFGQPVARFQAPAFRLAALYARIEAAAELTGQGLWLADRGAPVAAAARRALALAGDLVRDASAEAVQLHGAAGMTERSDAQRCYRRAAVDAVFLGTPPQLRAALAADLAAPQPAAAA
jgi:alkylation response protein AidB-like acyl-CoA dehydrogenase